MQLCADRLGATASAGKLRSKVQGAILLDMIVMVLIRCTRFAFRHCLLNVLHNPPARLLHRDHARPRPPALSPRNPELLQGMRSIPEMKIIFGEEAIFDGMPQYSGRSDTAKTLHKSEVESYFAGEGDDIW